MIIPDETARRFTYTFSDTAMAYEIAPKLACDEIDALAELLMAMNSPGIAQFWIDCHASADDVGDTHFIGPKEAPSSYEGPS
ncbi:hypothetical protein [Bailinhaonella thermotolerans]|uniref:Uncharacterized protein n=1 Tax=Bailinhaonella thermotolerans TaxID=1070861 RepID=A0A3A4AIZ4_9ACTN|nr:hypothetical protein [Bailinhaonella thermotolerans]RJL20790.1 hypothetical protein D5H75_38680 [Bailinhaonella thermotolerans]